MYTTAQTQCMPPWLMGKMILSRLKMLLPEKVRTQWEY
jgi:hypothetical protein